jgi:integrase
MPRDPTTPHRGRTRSSQRSATRFRAPARSSSTCHGSRRTTRFSPTRPSMVPQPRAPERKAWTPEEAARFLEHCHQADPFMADLCDLMIGTGMRRGGPLGLHWNDVHLNKNVLCVRHTSPPPTTDGWSSPARRPAPARTGSPSPTHCPSPPTAPRPRRAAHRQFTQRPYPRPPCDHHGRRDHARRRQQFARSGHYST